MAPPRLEGSAAAALAPPDIAIDGPPAFATTPATPQCVATRTTRPHAAAAPARPHGSAAAAALHVTARPSPPPEFTAA
jgi:hypothetical protein